MSRKRKYTAAIIGTGRIGFSLGFDRKREQPASHTMALKKNRRIKLNAGCDSNRVHLESWSKYNKKAALFSDPAHLFAAMKSDIVVVAVNEDSHLSVALSSIRAKPRLLILEKPVALTMEEGRRIQAEAFSAGVPVLVNHERRFSRDYKIAKKYMSRIGKVQTVNARLDSSLPVYDPAQEATGGYSLLHDGTHLVDIVQFLLEGDGSGAGSVSGSESGAYLSGNASISEDGSSCLESVAPTSSILSNIQLSSVYYDEKNPDVVRNITVHAESSLCPDVNFFLSGRSRYFGFEVEVIGTEGRFKIGNGIFEFYKREESKLYTGFYSLAPDRSILRPEKTHYFSNMVKNAVDFLDGKAPLLSDIQTGLNTLEVLENIKNKLKLSVV